MKRELPDYVLLADRCVNTADELRAYHRGHPSLTEDELRERSNTGRIFPEPQW